MNDTTRLPRRLALARRLCAYLPPIAAPRLRTALYPYDRARADDVRIVAESQTGSPLVAWTSDFHMYPFAVHGFFDWRNWAVARAVCAPGDVILEVGANVGTETIGFSDIVGPHGRVVALEPLPANVERLRKSLQMNRSRNIVVRPAAASDRDGVVCFEAPTEGWASGVGHVAEASGEYTPGMIEVDAVRLDSLRAELGTVRAIFSDTEGHEVAVLRGARQLLEQERPVIVLEASPKLLARAGESLQSLHDQLRISGYTPFRILRLGLEPVRALASRRASNWVCLHETERLAASDIAAVIRKCGLLPLVGGINPLRSPRSHLPRGVRGYSGTL